MINGTSGIAEVFFQHKKPSQRLDFKEIMKKIHSLSLGGAKVNVS